MRVKNASDNFEMTNHVKLPMINTQKNKATMRIHIFMFRRLRQSPGYFGAKKSLCDD